MTCTRWAGFLKQRDPGPRELIDMVVDVRTEGVTDKVTLFDGDVSCGVLPREQRSKEGRRRRQSWSRTFRLDLFTFFFLVVDSTRPLCAHLSDNSGIGEHDCAPGRFAGAAAPNRPRQQPCMGFVLIPWSTQWNSKKAPVAV